MIRVEDDNYRDAQWKCIIIDGFGRERRQREQDV